MQIVNQQSNTRIMMPCILDQLTIIPCLAKLSSNIHEAKEDGEERFNTMHDGAWGMGESE